MSQKRTYTWTNANPAVARNQVTGFTVAEITVVDETNGGIWWWNDQMANASYFDVDAGTITTTNGFTPLAQSTAIGATISGFTNANPGVLTVNDTATFGFAAGDTVRIGELADNGSATSLNGDFTVASTTGTTITLVENTTAYSVYVSGGRVSRVSDTTGAAIPTQNFAIRGITIGTGPVGGNSAVMSAVISSKENVV